MKFFAHFMSESCDHKYIQFSAKKQPKTEKDWEPILKANDMFDEDDVGPGMCETWWSLQHCEAIV